MGGCRPDNVKTLIFTLILIPGGLLQEAQVQHGSRCPAQERGQVGVGDRANKMVSQSLGDQPLAIPFNSEAWFLSQPYCLPIPM